MYITMARHILRTGQTHCYDNFGREIGCVGSGQESDILIGLDWPSPRFVSLGQAVEDRLTGLVWHPSANPLEFPLSWTDALAEIVHMNEAGVLGRNDWRMPNRREARSLIDHSRRDPALPAGHPFLDVFGGWMWTSTTAAIAPAYAWRIQLAGGRMFYGAKGEDGVLWPVAGESRGLAATGQATCHDEFGRAAPCGEIPLGQDGATKAGVAWPEPRFFPVADGVLDELTGLVWSTSANLTGGFVDWATALAVAKEAGPGFRLPTINELESLVDASRHSPALPVGHPFKDAPEALWSTTTSGYEHDWAFCLYLDKGAVGVGYKSAREFAAWAVR